MKFAKALFGSSPSENVASGGGGGSNSDEGSALNSTAADGGLLIPVVTGVDVATPVGASSSTTRYRSYVDPDDAKAPSSTATRRRYKGFSTSISHLHRAPPPRSSDPSSDDALLTSLPKIGFLKKRKATKTTPSARSSSSAVVDCCSMACFGILQNDRTRYAITGIKPPNFFKRVFLHICVPFAIFLLAGAAATTIKDEYANQFVSTMLVVCLVGYVAQDCIKGRRKNVAVREELLRMIREADAADGVLTPIDDGGGGGTTDEWTQTKREMHCAHHLIGCYPSDFPPGTSDEKSPDEDLCGCLSRTYGEACCAKLCGCYCQCCGVCAAAQEGREVDRLVEAGRRRFDYVTFEPYVEYYPRILSLRTSLDSSPYRHYKCLSHLSKLLVKSLVVILATLFVLSLIPVGRFRFKNMLVLLATFFQSFLLLYFVHWHWHKFDLSLDAVVKYYASGFVLSTGLAIFFEFCIGTVLQSFLAVLMLLSGVGVATDEDGYNSFGTASASSFGGGRGRQHEAHRPSRLGFPSVGWGFGQVRVLSDRKDYLHEYLRDHPGVMILYIFVSAYVLAALVEELCKYFGYAMVDHPDFCSGEELEESARVGPVHEEEEDAESASDDGGGRGADGTKAAATSAGGEDGFGGGGNPVEALTTAVVGAAASAGVADGFGVLGGGPNEAPTTGADEPSAPAAAAAAVPPDFSLQDRPANSVGSGIAVAMITVALGFSCCENLIYIFVYNGASFYGELVVLILRTLFPVHPIAAAIQSVGVCRRDLERDRSFKLGRIIFPAVLLHGSFDFAIMLSSFLVSLKDPNDASQPESGVTGLISLIVSFMFVLGGLMYYFREAREQIRRLRTSEDGFFEDDAGGGGGGDDCRDESSGLV